ncbi:MAG: cytidylate kinase-like family protein [Spirochaetia bacterium]|nr:cytidylate kinase-like family protein [Sphaerochaeta sp.]NCC63322.1 cytidylate kinase-like family protein [Spirochaetia bacterium]
MDTQTVFTIGRQFGSGGRQVGRLLSEKLGIPFYDKELIAISAQDSGLSEALFSNADEKATSSIFYSLVMGNYPMASGALGVTEMPLNDQLFLIQSKTIKRLAEEGPCVIVGRCADYILRDKEHVVNAFIHAKLESRIERAIKVYEIAEKKAEDTCLKADKQRANFYNYYSDRKWGMCRTYDLSLDSSKLGIEGCAEQIIAFEKTMKKHGGKGI